jgi:hypothetical protein
LAGQGCSGRSEGGGEKEGGKGGKEREDKERQIRQEKKKKTPSFQRCGGHLSICTLLLRLLCDVPWV